jgi:hypothetical protein
MEALRNYVQHRGFPIHAISYPSKWLDVEDHEKSKLQFSVIPYLDISTLAEDKFFKRRVLHELQKKDVENKKRLDIRLFIQEYVKCIGKIHEKIREIVKADLKEWENTLENVFMLYKNEFGGKTLISVLVVVAIKDDTHWVEKHEIFNDFIERRKKLEKKNRIFVNLSKRFITNEIQKSGS